MRRIRKFLLVFATIILMLPSFHVTAASNDSKPREDPSPEKGEISSKDEVVYAKLNANGKSQEIYVVNILDVEKAGKIIDYGPYTSLKNLTDLSRIEQKNNRVEFTAPQGKFYYQGKMVKNSLPWDISVSYLLDGKEMTPEEIAGKDGHVQIRIATSANEKADPTFIKNYLLQISLSLDLERYSNIQAPDGMLANAGKNKQITFTVMPEEEKEMILEADAVDFELEGINITAIPPSLPVDAPDISKMTGGMKALTSAIGEANKGVGQLKNGVAELNNGVKNLRNGSEAYKDGISAIDASSSKLVNASRSIEQALETLNRSLSNNPGEIGLGDLKKLKDGLSQIANGLEKAAQGLDILKENHATAYSALNKAMKGIPDYKISEEEIRQLYKSGADHAVLDQLVETYSAARVAKGTYSSVKGGFAAVDVSLGQISRSLAQMANNLDTMADGLSSAPEAVDIADSFAKLQKGIATLSSNYKAFHSGLVDYTAGVSQLSSSYKEMHNGVEDLSKGTGKLENGASKLHNGTSELYASTSDLPGQMKQEVDQLMADYDKSDFEAVSFVSPGNKNISSVQFVFKTESIKQEKPEETEKPAQERKGVWARLKDLFL
ncbi:YhgE/Pip domain-containing protein [Thermoactinomyces mirandus]|uniref:YhgE/Pip domain-containing protein n=1 Tax=Thermoactinomyces mirandus TaxID=2756294 RepID=A0A7W1XRF8_9BACL|nr:YhgE/Pip domain-containing protein [Thermoactinomyces mirandus]MBA4601751.1 YhgE/Pip domain-containing protein [Thermoactinomyces mirandus]